MYPMVRICNSHWMSQMMMEILLRILKSSRTQQMRTRMTRKLRTTGEIRETLKTPKTPKTPRTLLILRILQATMILKSRMNPQLNRMMVTVNQIGKIQKDPTVRETLMLVKAIRF